MIVVLLQMQYEYELNILSTCNANNAVLIFDTKCAQYATLTPAHHSFQYLRTSQALELILS